jgi:hypothetical protein
MSQKIEWKNVNIDKDKYQRALALHVQYVQLEQKTTIDVTISDFFDEVREIDFVRFSSYQTTSH